MFDEEDAANYVSEDENADYDNCNDDRIDVMSGIVTHSWATAARLNMNAVS